MTRWLVTLAGDAADLDQLVEWPDGDDWKIVRHDMHGVAMCGERFEVLDDHGSVHRGGEALLAHLNRAARHRLTKFQGVSLGATVEQEKGGDDLALLGHDAVHVHATASATVWAHLHAEGVAIGARAQSDAPPPGTDCVRLVLLLEANPHLVAALDYIQDGGAWDNSYKAFEAIRDAIGGQKAVLRADWCTKRALDRFTQVVRPYRHDDWPEVEQRMIDAEGRAFVLDLLTKLIAYLDGAGS
jgi:hypothetical protein